MRTTTNTLLTLVALALLATLLSTNAQAAATPDSIGGLALWLRGDAGTFSNDPGTIPANGGDTVERWNDQSGNNRTANGFNSPTLVDPAINGLPAIDFDEGNQDHMFLATPGGGTNPIATNPDQWTIFTVFRQEPGDVSQDHIFTHRNSGTQLIQASVQGNEARLQLRGSGNNLVDFTAPGVVNGDYNIAMYQFDTVNDLHAVAVNGGPETQNTTDFGAQNFIADSQRIGFFHNGSTSSGWFNGQIAEILVYNDVALSDSEKNMVGFYLQEKYGIDAAFTGAVPEPGTCCLVGLALVGMTVSRRRRRR